MPTVEFDSDNKLHQKLFETFKSDLVCDIYDNNHIYCQYTDYIDRIDSIVTTIANNDLDIYEDFDEYISFAIQNSNPKDFTIIVGLEYIDYDDTHISFIKLSGCILVENDKTIILDIDETSPDYSSQREFVKAKQIIKNG